MGKDADMPDAVRERLDRCGGTERLAGSLPSRKLINADAALHKALSDPKRLVILHLLRDGPLCVCVLKQVLRIPDSKLSYHLGVLKRHRLISGSKEGNWITYTLSPLGQSFISATGAADR